MHFHSRKSIWKCRLENGSHFVSAAMSLQWRHDERDCVSNHRFLRCLLNCCFRCRSKNTSKLRVSALCAGNSPVTGEFPAQKFSNAENVSILWRHHGVNWVYPMTYSHSFAMACFVASLVNECDTFTHVLQRSIMGTTAIVIFWRCTGKVTMDVFSTPDPCEVTADHAKGITLITKALRSTSIRYRSDA